MAIWDDIKGGFTDLYRQAPLYQMFGAPEKARRELREVPREPYEFDEAAFQDPFRAENRQRLDQYLQEARTRGPSQFQAGQGEQIERLQAIARGEAPSLAEMQARRSGEQNLAAAIAQMQTAGGGINPALAARQIGRQRAEIGQDIASQAAQARLAEQRQAEGALTGALGSARGGDIQEQQMRDTMVRDLLGKGLDLDRAQFLANMQLESLRGQEFGSARDAALRAALGNLQATEGASQGMMGAISNLLPMLLV